jgi:hypothetical protein
VVSTAVEIFDRWFAEVRESLLQFVQVVAGEHIVARALGSPGHDRTILASSPYIPPSQARGLGAPAMTDFATLIWPRFGRLNWPHLI